MFAEGTLVSYKGISGVISFCNKQYITILIKEGQYRAQDVKIVVYKSDYKLIHAHPSQDIISFDSK